MEDVRWKSLKKPGITPANQSKWSNRNNMYDVDSQLESLEERLHADIYSTLEEVAICDYCESKYLPSWEEVCGSTFDDDVEFCCEECRDAYEEE